MGQGRAIAPQAEKIWGWGSPAGQLRAQRRAALLIIGAHLGLGRDVLEIGCGTGVFTEHFAETGANITALDLSPDLLDQAKVRVNGVQFRLGDAECLPFEAESFDAVVGSSILHHVNLQIVLDEIWRVLRKGGRITFAEPNMLNPQIMIERIFPPCDAL